MRFPHVSIVRGHAVVTVGSSTGIRLKILVNAWDSPRVIHRFAIDDIPLHDNDKKQHYNTAALRVLVSVAAIIVGRRGRKKYFVISSHNSISFQGGEIL